MLEMRFTALIHSTFCPMQLDNNSQVARDTSMQLLVRGIGQIPTPVLYRMILCAASLVFSARTIHTVCCTA